MFYCSSYVQFDAFITSENNKGKKVKGYRPTFDIAPLRSESPPQKRSGNMALMIFGQGRFCAGPLHGNGDVIATKELARVDTQLLQHREKVAKLTLIQSSLCHRRPDTRQSSAYSSIVRIILLYFTLTRNSAVADKPRDAFVQYAMTWETA